MTHCHSVQNSGKEMTYDEGTASRRPSLTSSYQPPHLVFMPFAFHLPFHHPVSCDIARFGLKTHFIQANANRYRAAADSAGPLDVPKDVSVESASQRDGGSKAGGWPKWESLLGKAHLARAEIVLGGRATDPTAPEMMMGVRFSLAVAGAVEPEDFLFFFGVRNALCFPPRSPPDPLSDPVCHPTIDPESSSSLSLPLSSVTDPSDWVSLLSSCESTAFPFAVALPFPFAPFSLDDSGSYSDISVSGSSSRGDGEFLFPCDFEVDPLF